MALGREYAPYLKESEVCQGRGGGGARSTTRYDDRGPLLPSRSSSSCTRRSPAVPGLPVWVSRGGHRSGFCRTPWSSLPTSCPWFRSLTFLWCWEEGIGSRRCAQARRAVCRAGYRSARDVFGLGPPAFCGTSYSDGGKCRRTRGIRWRWSPRSTFRGERSVEFSQDWVFLMVVEGVVHVEGLQGSLREQNSAAVVEQIVDIPAIRGLPDSLPGQGSSSSSGRLRDDADEDFTGFFSREVGWARTQGRNCSPSRAHPPGVLMKIGMLQGDGFGFRGLASLGPFLGAPAGPRGRLNFLGVRGQGAWHPLTPSWVPLRGCTKDHGSRRGGSACAYCRGTDRGMPVPQIMPVRGGGQLVRRSSTGAVLGQGC